MILIGQYDSPFVRRVGIALTLYDLAFEHRPWSIFADADKIRPYNPLTRVPTLVLDDGSVLVESHLILDYLDSLVPAERVLFPRNEPARHQALKVAALATGLADKGVSLFYEKRLHKEVSRHLGRTLPEPDNGRARRAGARSGVTFERLLVRQPHRPCRHCRCRGIALRYGCASRPHLVRSPSSARSPLRTA
jgi:glutathione S-transferase